MLENITDDKIELRAHHLASIAAQLRAPDLSLKARKTVHYIWHYQDDSFAEYFNTVIDDIIHGKIRQIILTNGHDIICQKCPQRINEHCKVAGKLWSADFLSNFDNKFAENCGLEIGETYETDDILNRMSSIRRAFRKTLMQIPRLLKTSAK